MDSNTDLSQQPDTPQQQPPRSLKPPISIWKVISNLLLIVNLVFGCLAFLIIFSVFMNPGSAAEMAYLAIIFPLFFLAPIDLIALLFYVFVCRPHGRAKVLSYIALIPLILVLIYIVIFVISSFD